MRKIKTATTIGILSVLLTLSGCGATSSDSPDVSLKSLFTKETTVFDIPIYGSNDVSASAMRHVASVLAEYLDSNEDGTPNNQDVVDKLKASAMVVFASQEDEESTFEGVDGGLSTPFVTVYENEIVSPNGLNGRFDASLEEVLHLVTQLGYSLIYPEELGESINTDIANAMDTARGGRFLSTPSTYPDGAWYTYNDQSCDYSCMITEYIYWGITSRLGAQDFPGREQSISNEWALNTADKINATDTALHTILTNSTFNWPTALPNGTYNAQTFTIIAI